MKRLILTLFVIGTLLSVSGVQAQSTSDIQVILKSQNYGLDKAFGVYRANITVSMNKMGSLTYRESYYKTDYTNGAGQPVLFRTNSYDVVMSGYTVSFPVTRPGLRSERDSWNTIKATVVLDKEVVFETWISQSGTYRSFVTGKTVWTNDSSVTIGKTRPNVDKKPSIFEAPVTNTDNNTGTDSADDSGDESKKAPMIETIFILGIIIFCVYYQKKKEIKDEK